MTRASRRKHHIIYKTTCLVTGRYYVGMHSTDDLNDTYLGSGLRLLRSVKKYGADQHRREILEDLPTREAASSREKELITEEMRADPECLNCGAGGLGAVDRPPTTEGARKKLSAAMRAHHASEAGEVTKQRLSEYHTGRKRPPETGEKIAARQRAHYAKNVVIRSEESKQKTSATMAGKPKPAETVDRMKAACTGRRKMWRDDGTWFWGRMV
jgi:hypothetical protein